MDRTISRSAAALAVAFFLLPSGLGLTPPVPHEAPSGTPDSKPSSEQASVTIPPKVDDVSGNKLTVAQFNFAGNGFNQGSTTTPVDDLVKKISSLDADIITLNEVCVSQANAIWNALRARPGYENAYKQTVKTNYSVPNCAGGTADDDYAMAIISRWPMTFPTDVGDGGFYASYTTIEPTRHRRVMCMDVQVPENAVRTCVTHLEEHHLTTTTGTNINESQAQQLAATLAPMLSENRVILAGDMNVLPHDARLNPIYDASAAGASGFIEADQYDWRAEDGVRSGDITFAPVAVADEIPGQEHTGTRKLDYIFAEEEDFVVARDSAGVIPSSYSDHLLLVARIALK